MNPVRVFLGGEGRNELGSRARESAYQTDEQPGVLQALLRRTQPDGWTVAGATQWKNIRKLDAKGPTPTEERNVLGLVVEAIRAESRVVAFVRDADDDADRPRVIANAIEKARQAFSYIDVIGGIAVPALEGWILAMTGEHGTEALGKAAAQSRLVDKGIAAKDTAAMVAKAETFASDGLPGDAKRLRQWLEVAREVLPRLVNEQRSNGS